MIDTKKYEAMAKLDLNDAERQIVQERAYSFVNSFSALEDIDTADTEPLVTVLEHQSVLRDDCVKKWNNREKLLSSAPDQYDGFFRLPKALD